MSSSTERQRRYRARMRAAGFVQVEALVPSECVEPLRKLAAQMRAQHLAKLSVDD